MKQESLQHMLSRYKDGTLSDEELEQLNKLTHRDEVMASATNRARGIVRRRTMRTIGLSVTVAVVLCAGIWMITSGQKSIDNLEQASEMIAMNTTDEPNVVQQTTESAPATIEPADPAKQIKEKPIKREDSATKKKNRSIERIAIDRDETRLSAMQEPIANATDKPIVRCNNQCDADSVISDIWKFLSA